ncbi:UNVERIFIED_CONTAM: hypothetical protein FKN15_046823 [Acipenser sinensis]
MAVRRQATGIFAFFFLLREPIFCDCLYAFPIMWLMPVSTFPGRANLTAEVMPAVHLALHHLRKHPSALKDSGIQFYLEDTQVTFHLAISDL